MRSGLSTTVDRLLFILPTQNHATTQTKAISRGGLGGGVSLGSSFRQWLGDTLGRFIPLFVCGVQLRHVHTSDSNLQWNGKLRLGECNNRGSTFWLFFFRMTGLLNPISSEKKNAIFFLVLRVSRFTYEATGFFTRSDQQFSFSPIK